MRPTGRLATTESSVERGKCIRVSGTDPRAIPSVSTRHPSIRCENSGECSRENTPWGSWYDDGACEIALLGSQAATTNSQSREKMFQMPPISG